MNGQCPIGPRLEVLAEPMGQASDLGRVADRLVALMQLAITSDALLDLGLLASELLGALGLAVASGEFGQAVACGEIGRIRRDEPFHRLSLGLAMAAPRGQPGRQPFDLGRSRLGGGQMGHGFACLGDPVGRHGPVQPGAPDRRILGTALPAGVEPPRRLIVRARADRQVGFR